MSKSVKVGTIRKTQKGNLILVLGNGISILKDGAPVKIDEQFKTLSLFDATEGVNALVEKGFIDADDANSRLEYIADKNISKDVVAFINN